VISPSRGIIYSATGATYIAEAIASAASSLRFNRLPHLIFCDTLPASAPAGIELRAFAACGDPFLDKIRNIRQSPFEQTLFIDTDTYIAASLDDVFDLLLRFDIAAAHVPGYTKCDDRGQSEAFYDLNTGVIAYRGTLAVEAFLGAWDRLHTEWSANPPFPLLGQDQAAFRRALWESQLSLYVLSPEYNYRTIFPGRLVGAAKIIHGRSPDYRKIEARINASRGRPRSFPPFASKRRWYDSLVPGFRA
jgi:hypothetical protein